MGKCIRGRQGKKRKPLSSCVGITSPEKFQGYFSPRWSLVRIRYEANQRIATSLDRARIPIVLLDRCLEPYPRRSKYDLVGIDNRRTAYRATEHLITAGAKRVAFFARPNSAPTVDGRIAGYHEALISRPGLRRHDLVKIGDPSDEAFIKSILKKDRPDAFLCANDHTAGDLNAYVDVPRSAHSQGYPGRGLR